MGHENTKAEAGVIQIREHKEEAGKTLPRLAHTFHGSGPRPGSS